MDLLAELTAIVANKDWDKITVIINPTMFHSDVRDTLNRKVIAKLAYILTREATNQLTDDVIAILLRCMTNLSGSFNHKTVPKYICEEDKDLYIIFCQDIIDNDKYPLTCFPYDGVIKRTIQILISITEQYQESVIPDDKLEIVRISFRFLCNIMASNESNLTNDGIDFENIIKCITSLGTLNYLQENSPLLYAICTFIHNIVNDPILNKDYIHDGNLKFFCHVLLKADKLEISPARDALICLIFKSAMLKSIYNCLTIDHKLYLLELIYQTLISPLYEERRWQSDNEFKLSEDSTEFISERFKRRSDLILKTEVSYLKDMDPREVIILLDILGVLSSTSSSDYQILRKDKSLLINAVFLLKAVHMAGKEKDNCFTPIQKLSELAPSTYTDSGEKKDYVQHPTFGFKTALIRLIGNLVYKNKINQDTVRDIDGISLLLDCCNIDARNPLITQWNILAIRNLTEYNLENQEFIKNSQKIKFIDTPVIREMGVTLNQDDTGKILGIVSLPKNE